MFGFVIGALSLVGLMKLHRFSHYGHGHHGRHGGPRRWMLRRLFQHLDTTPGQEKVVLNAVEEVEKAAFAARNTLFASRPELANSLRGEHFDGAAVDAAFEKQQAAIDEVKKALRAGLAAVHEALNPDQRKQLADLLEMGPRGLRGHCGFHGSC
jgi:hypothetical protein